MLQNGSRQSRSMLSERSATVRLKAKERFKVRTPGEKRTFARSSFQLSLAAMMAFWADCAGICHKLRQGVCDIADDTLLELHHSMADLAERLRLS